MIRTTVPTGVAAGVPFVAIPPDTARSTSAPIVVAWHLMDPPRTEAALAAALPLRGLDAWRTYLGLPFFGSRTPAGGTEEMMRLAAEDEVVNLQGPVAYQAAEEFEPALSDVRSRLAIGEGPLGVVGGSIGAAIALLVIAESTVDISAAVVVSPVVQLRKSIEATERALGTTYAWSARSLAIARRLDFVARADEIARRRMQPAILFVVGEEDDPAYLEAANVLRGELARRYDDPTRVDVKTVPGMGHALAEEPGLEPAPQKPYAAEVDRLAVSWLQRHL